MSTSNESPSELRALTALRVAVADDDRSMCELLVRMLRKLGHDVVAVADSGLALIEKCAQAEPDVIITDNLMPELGGADAAAMIYAHRPVPIILLSGYCDRNLVLEAEEKHVLIYLVKPISEDNLRAALQRCRGLVQAFPRADEPELPWQSGPKDTTGRSPRTAPYPQGIRPSQYMSRGS